MDRQQSKHEVVVFDPNRDPSVATELAVEIQKDPTVIAIKATRCLGMVKGPQGTYWLDNEGCGSKNTIETRGCPVEFHREFVGGSFEPIPFSTATFRLDECQACETGEKMTLDKFIGTGKRKDANFAEWEKILNDLPCRL